MSTHPTSAPRRCRVCGDPTRSHVGGIVGSPFCVICGCRHDWRSDVKPEGTPEQPPA